MRCFNSFYCSYGWLDPLGRLATISGVTGNGGIRGQITPRELNYFFTDVAQAAQPAVSQVANLRGRGDGSRTHLSAERPTGSSLYSNFQPPFVSVILPRSIWRRQFSAPFLPASCRRLSRSLPQISLSCISPRFSRPVAEACPSCR